MTSISTTMVSSIEQIMTNDGIQMNMKNLFIMDTKHRIKHLKLCSKNDFLNKCLKKKIATNEIILLAKKIVSENGNVTDVTKKR